MSSQAGRSRNFGAIRPEADARADKMSRFVLHHFLRFIEAIARPVRTGLSKTLCSSWILAVVLLTPGFAQSTWIVDIAGSGDFLRIGDAISDSRVINGDLVLVFPGLYPERIDFSGKAITIKSQWGPLPTVIDGRGSGPVVTFSSGETTSSVLDGFTITNGTSTEGGGIYCQGASPRVVACWIARNSATRGGGLWADSSSSPLIQQCLFVENDGGGAHLGANSVVSDCTFDSNSGGGASVSSSALIEDCTFVRNSHWAGGGLTVSGGAPTIKSCRFVENVATNRGGGIRLFDDQSVLEDCVIQLNDASTSNGNTGAGGGVYFENSFATLRRCEINHNSVDGSGGGLYSGYTSSSTVVECRIEENVAGGGGGGGVYSEGSMGIWDSWIEGNTASGPGGGIAARGGGLSVSGSTFQGNQANVGGGIWLVQGSPSVSNTTIVGNVAEHGAGVFIEAAAPLFEDSQILKNAAGDNGGGVYCDSALAPLILNCLVGGNTARNGGGLFLEENANPSIQFCTVSGNSAVSGGGIYCDWFSAPVIGNSILWGNGDSLYAFVGSSPVVTYSDVEAGTGRFWFGLGCIDQDPLLIGVFFLSHVATGQVLDSPCVDMGDPSSVAPGLTTRIDGQADLGIADFGFHHDAAYSGPHIRVEGLEAGGQVSIFVEQASPFGVVRLAYSTTGGGPTSTPWGSALLTPPFQPLPHVFLDKLGTGSSQVSVPLGTSGLDVWFQGLDLETLTLSNGVDEVVE